MYNSSYIQFLDQHLASFQQSRRKEKEEEESLRGKSKELESDLEKISVEISNLEKAISQISSKISEKQAIFENLKKEEQVRESKIQASAF